MMEVLVFVDGVDAMTSKALQARKSYEPAEMAMNEQVSILSHSCMTGNSMNPIKALHLHLSTSK